MSGPNSYIAEWLDSEYFYELCQSYRHAQDAVPEVPGMPTASEAFEALKIEIARHCGPSSEQWWRDASRERPHRDRLVIAWSEPYGAVLADRMTNNPDFGWSCSGHVTHWMPLPDAPDATQHPPEGK